MIPNKFKWLETIGTLPKLVSAGLQYLGLREIPGGKSNPVIMEMAKGIGVEKIYTNDDMSWCALLINHLLRICGKPLNLQPKDKYDLLRALKTAEDPRYIIIPFREAVLGDIVRLKRTGGGHVTIFIAATKKGFYGFGGNQGNQTSFAEFPADRVESVRRYYSKAPPESAKRYTMLSDGKMSVNEA